MRTHTRRTSAAALGLLACAIARDVRAAALANSISVSGDSISRGYDANTGSCNYGDNVSRSWATGDDHGTSFSIRTSVSMLRGCRAMRRR